MSAVFRDKYGQAEVAIRGAKGSQFEMQKFCDLGLRFVLYTFQNYFTRLKRQILGMLCPALFSLLKRRVSGADCEAQYTSAEH